MLHSGGGHESGQELTLNVSDEGGADGRHRGVSLQAKEQAVLNKQADALLGYFMDQGPRMQLQTGVKMGWTRLYDMAGVSTLSSAIVANNNWLKEAKNQDRTMTIIHTEKTKGKPIPWSSIDDWKDSQDLLAKYAKLQPQSDLNVYFTNTYLSEPPYLPKK